VLVLGLAGAATWWFRSSRADRRLPMAVLAAAMSVVTLGLAIDSLVQAHAPRPALSTATVAVPDLRGVDPAVASAALGELGLRPEIVTECHPGATGDRVSTAYTESKTALWTRPVAIITTDGVTAFGTSVQIGTRVFLRVPDAARCAAA
jgi:hypothetical protein